MAVLMRDPDGRTVEVDTPTLVTNLRAHGYSLVEDADATPDTRKPAAKTGDGKPAGDDAEN